MEDPEDGFDFLRRALGELFGDELRCGFPGLLFILQEDDRVYVREARCIFKTLDFTLQF